MSEWGGYRAILEEAREIEKENREQERHPVACPRCGEPLVENERLKMLACPLGHFRQPN